MMLCIPCSVMNCEGCKRECTTATGASIGLLCECDHGEKRKALGKKKPGVRIVKRPRSMS